MTVRLGVDGRELAAGRRTGIGRYVREVLRAAAGRGWRVRVYGDAETELGEALQGVTLARLRAPGTRWWDQIAVPRALARDGAQAFLSPYYKGPVLAPCPVILTVHDLYFIGYGGRRSLRDAALIAAARLYARRARAIVADSEHSRRAAITLLGVAPEKVTAIPVALGPEFVPAALPEAARARYGITGAYVLYVGNFMPHKNVDGLLRAWASLPAALRAGHRLVLAGADAARRPALEALARALNVAATVTFPGRIEDADLPGLYSACAAFVLPSLEEGFGLPAIEAMACGAPVIVSDRGALPEMAGPGAAVVDVTADGALAAALTRTLLDAEHREALRRRGRARALDFTPARTASRVLDLIEAVVHGVAPVEAR
ncbi:MAG TPA: glycosyltransferase family 1 protein [Methylomirabilota bacterium]|nr:glycosyltransferase family 1 protein [Methylomirabilota bacterium]